MPLHRHNKADGAIEAKQQEELKVSFFGLAQRRAKDGGWRNIPNIGGGGSPTLSSGRLCASLCPLVPGGTWKRRSMRAWRAGLLLALDLQGRGGVNQAFPGACHREKKSQAPEHGAIADRRTSCQDGRRRWGFPGTATGQKQNTSGREEKTRSRNWPCHGHEQTVRFKI